MGLKARERTLRYFLPFLRYIHCNFCLNPHIIHGDMEENVSGCFFLNTVYYKQTEPEPSKAGLSP